MRHQVELQDCDADVAASGAVKLAITSSRLIPPIATARSEIRFLMTDALCFNCARRPFAREWRGGAPSGRARNEMPLPRSGLLQSV